MFRSLSFLVNSRTEEEKKSAHLNFPLFRLIKFSSSSKTQLHSSFAYDCHSALLCSEVYLYSSSSVAFSSHVYLLLSFVFIFIGSTSCFHFFSSISIFSHCVGGGRNTCQYSKRVKYLLILVPSRFFSQRRFSSRIYCSLSLLLNSHLISKRQ